MEFSKNRPEHSPREEMLIIMTTDFRTPEQIEAQQAISERKRDPTLIQAISLDELTALSIDEEEYEDRRMSDECTELATKTLSLLDEVNITDTFKMEIMTKVVKAYASKSIVPDTFVQRLGISGGEGIFDPDEAPEREANSMRGFLSDIAERLGVAKRENGTLIIATLTPWPQQALDHNDDLETLQAWELDYESKYGISPLGEGFDFQDYLLASKTLHVVKQTQKN